jgi:hypothetical protein
VKAASRRLFTSARGTTPKARWTRNSGRSRYSQGKQKGNDTGTVYPRKNKTGKVIGWRGACFTPDDADCTSSWSAPTGRTAKVKQEVLVHLGHHEKPEDTLAAWPSEVSHLRATGRSYQADWLEVNLKKLTALIEEEKREE